MQISNNNLFTELKSLLKITYSNWRDDRTLRLGAGLAYYVMFSIIPVLALTVFLASLLFPEESVISYFKEQFQTLFSSSGVDATNYFTGESLLSTVETTFKNLGIFGIISLVVTSSFAVLALNDSVNIIWGHPVIKGWKNMAKRYVFSYLIVLGFAVLLVLLLVVQSIIAFMEAALAFDGLIINFLTSTATVLITWTLVVVALAWLIRVLSNKQVSWLNGVVGAAVTIFFMYVGVKVIGTYITNFSFNSVTSAFSALLLALVWVYYEAQILLAGFQLTKALSEGKYLRK